MKTSLLLALLNFCVAITDFTFWVTNGGILWLLSSALFLVATGAWIGTAYYQHETDKIRRSQP